MKQEIPPWVAVVIVVAVVLLVGAYLYFGTGPGRKAKEIEDAISATVSKPGKKMPGAAPGAPGPPGPPAGAPAGQPGSSSR